MLPSSAPLSLTLLTSSTCRDPERKTRLLEYVQRTRHKLLRLRVLLKWCQESHALIERSQVRAIEPSVNAAALYRAALLSLNTDLRALPVT